MITDLKTDWDSIENNHEKRKLAAENAIQEIEDRKELENKILVSNEKYELYKTSYLIQQPKAVIKSTIRTALFGSSDIGDDMMFTWVNKDNILKVYDTFTSTVEKNKATYSREDWDEIKLLYEALDTRKNTVENEGLTGTDNMKIASIKFKFAPLLKINRISSKAEENEEAKE
jgi:trehalose-6-phosphatase